MKTIEDGYTGANTCRHHVTGEADIPAWLLRALDLVRRETTPFERVQAYTTLLWVYIVLTGNRACTDERIAGGRIRFIIDEELDAAWDRLTREQCAANRKLSRDLSRALKPWATATDMLWTLFDGGPDRQRRGE